MKKHMVSIFFIVLFLPVCLSAAALSLDGSATGNHYLPFISMLAVFSFLLFIFVSLFRRRYSQKDFTCIGKSDRKPDCSPFLAALYSGYFPSVDEAFLSFLLYWKESGIIDIEFDKREFKLTILKPLPVSAPKEEKQIFQHVFGYSATVHSKDLSDKGKYIKDDILSYGENAISSKSISDKDSSRIRNIMIAITLIFSIFSGIISTGLCFGLSTLIALFSSLSLYIITVVLASSYYKEKENLEVFGKLRFFAFPLVCYLFFSGYYGYIFSGFSSSAIGMIAGFLLALGIFSGAFLSFGINKLDKNVEELMLSSIAFRNFLESSKGFSTDNACYCISYGLTSHIKSLMDISLLRQCIVKSGIEGKRKSWIYSGFGFFIRNRKY